MLLCKIKWWKKRKEFNNVLRRSLTILINSYKNDKDIKVNDKKNNDEND